MNDKILQKLLKSIGKIVVQASTANCCCVDCVPSVSTSANCAAVGGTFYLGSNCSEFAGNCCKMPVSGQELLVVRNDPVVGRFIMNGVNQNISVLSTGANMPSCGSPVVITRLPCCRKWVNKRCVISIINFPRISSPGWRGREGPHQCRTVLIQNGDPNQNRNYMVVCTPVTE